jgi:hypothetical protein
MPCSSTCAHLPATAPTTSTATTAGAHWVLLLLLGDSFALPCSAVLHALVIVSAWDDGCIWLLHIAAFPSILWYSWHPEHSLVNITRKRPCGPCTVLLSTSSRNARGLDTFYIITECH